MITVNIQNLEREIPKTLGENQLYLRSYMTSFKVEKNSYPALMSFVCGN